MNLKRFAGAATAVAALSAVGVASAAWTSGGSGTASGRAGTAQGVVVTSATVSGNLLYPGGTGDVVMTVTNPNPYPVTVTSVAPNGTITATGGQGACTTTGVTFTTVTGASLGTVPARVGSTDGTAVLTLTNAASMGTTSDSGCQGATFSVPVTVQVSS